MAFFKTRKLGKVYTDGEIIFKEGDVANLVLLIQEGHVELSINGISKVVLGKDDAVGISCIFEPGVRGATAIAVGETRLISIERTLLIKQISTDPSMMYKMLKMSVRRLRQCEAYCRQNMISEETEVIPPLD
jgi:CRP/FNR family transcriptional regulator, cyclic AMP receptor protein